MKVSAALSLVPESPMGISLCLIVSWVPQVVVSLAKIRRWLTSINRASFTRKNYTRHVQYRPVGVYKSNRKKAHPRDIFPMRVEKPRTIDFFSVKPLRFMALRFLFESDWPNLLSQPSTQDMTRQNVDPARLRSGWHIYQNHRFPGHSGHPNVEVIVFNKFYLT